MMARTYKIFLIAFGLFNSFVLAAQSTLKIPFSHKLGPAEGLSSYNASKIVQDHFGFIWIATQDGLNRYDGKSFVIYSKSSRPDHRLLGNVINNMVLDTARSMLWVTTSYGGLNGIDLVSGEVRHTYKGIITPGGFPHSWLKCFNIARGIVWIGTPGGLALYDPARSEFVSCEPLPWEKKEDTPFNINYVLVDAFDHVWLFLPAYGIAVYSATTKKCIRFYSAQQLGTNEYLDYLQFSSRVCLYKGNSFIWATDHGLKWIGFNERAEINFSRKELPINKVFGRQAVYACAVDKGGRVWFSTLSQLVVADIVSGNYQVVKDIAAGEENDWIKNTFGVFFDRDNNLWLGTQKGVTFTRNARPPFLPYYSDKKNRIAHAYHILPGDGATVFVAAQNGLFKINTDSDRIELLDSSSTYNYVFKLENHLVVSRPDGIFIFESGRFKSIGSVYRELRVLDAEVLNNTTSLGDSLVFFSSEKAGTVYCWKRKDHMLYVVPVVPDTINNNIVNGIFKNAENELFILYDNAIGRLSLSPLSIKRFQVEDPGIDLPLSIILDMCQMQNDYWVAVYGKGLVRTDKRFRIKKIYALEEGLTNVGVYKLIPSGDSMLYITTNNGLFSLHVGRGAFRRYGKTDGLNTDNYEENAGCASGGFLYAGGVAGFSKIDPANISGSDPPPPTFIHGAEIKMGASLWDTFNLRLQKIMIPPGALQTTIRFAAINFSDPGAISYSYRIRELHDDFITLGTQDFITITGMRPGSYTLIVKAANESGDWGAPSAMDFTVMPAWYQSLWLKISLLLLVFAVIYALYKYRLLQLAARQKIREEIASDLHDDIGSTLNSAKLFTHLAQRGEDKGGYLDMAEESITQASVSLRDMLWVLDNSGDTVVELLERIRKFAVPLATAAGIKFEALTHGDIISYSLTKVEKKNLLLVTKEAINNSIKYAGCTKICLTITCQNKKLALEIKDNGKGFDTTTKMGGHGLKNMVQRARQMNYIASITSIEGRGTAIRITNHRAKEDG